MGARIAVPIIEGPTPLAPTPLPIAAITRSLANADKQPTLVGLISSDAKTGAGNQYKNPLTALPVGLSTKELGQPDVPKKGTSRGPDSIFHRDPKDSVNPMLSLGGVATNSPKVGSKVSSGFVPPSPKPPPSPAPTPAISLIESRANHPTASKRVVVEKSWAYNPQYRVWLTPDTSYPGRHKWPEAKVRITLSTDIPNAQPGLHVIRNQIAPKNDDCLEVCHSRYQLVVAEAPETYTTLPEVSVDLDLKANFGCDHSLHDRRRNYCRENAPFFIVPSLADPIMTGKYTLNIQSDVALTIEVLEESERFIRPEEQEADRSMGFRVAPHTRLVVDNGNNFQDADTQED